MQSTVLIAWCLVTILQGALTDKDVYQVDEDMMNVRYDPNAVQDNFEESADYYAEPNSRYDIYRPDDAQMEVIKQKRQPKIPNDFLTPGRCGDKATRCGGYSSTHSTTPYDSCWTGVS